MAYAVRIKDHWAEQRMFTVRSIWAVCLVVLLLLIQVGRLYQLQIVDFQRYTELSHGNRIRIEPVPPIRGLIYDRYGTILAQNLPAYQLVLIPEQVADMQDTLARLEAEGLINDEHVLNFREQRKGKRSFQAIPIRFRMSDEELSRFAVKRLRFPGVDIQATLTRHYPLNESAVHALGYVGAVSVSDLEGVSAASYAGTTHMGKLGVERAFENLLHGKVGYRQLIVNAQGREITQQGNTDVEVNNQEPAPGFDLITSLDAGIQRAAEIALGDNRGAAVALDPWTGDILAFASTPAYDPNPFGGGLTAAQYQALRNNIDRPLINRALRGHYPPGSTIKPIIALAGLDYGATNMEFTTFCRGYFTLPGHSHRYRDWRKEGHGPINLSSAISQSCDVYFYALAVELGIDRMHAMMTSFGFGLPTGIDVPGEKAGLMPSRTWKRLAFSRRSDQVWFPGETVITGIGQGYTLATPLQLAHATGIIATRGIRYQPRLVIATVNSFDGSREDIAPIHMDTVRLANESYWDDIHLAMSDVVNGERGTARAISIGSPVAIAGKTGTAQVFSVGQDEEYDAEEVAERLRHHALFVAFAPVDDPQIAVSVIVENGGSGSGVAAPVARQIIDAWVQTQDATIGTSTAETVAESSETGR